MTTTGISPTWTLRKSDADVVGTLYPDGGLVLHRRGCSYLGQAGPIDLPTVIHPRFADAILRVMLRDARTGRPLCERCLIEK